MSTAMFGAGCFWSVEHAFRQVEGVTETEVGYAGGTVENPTYELVCSDTTGHAEVVRVRYDPAVLPYDKLLDTFFTCHDPTQRDRQGPDVGKQYRSAIFFFDEAQREAAERKIELLKKDRDIATQIVPAATFYRAEEYHQRYIEKNGGAACGI